MLVSEINQEIVLAHLEKIDTNYNITQSIFNIAYLRHNSVRSCKNKSLNM